MQSLLRSIGELHWQQVFRLALPMLIFLVAVKPNLRKAIEDMFSEDVPHADVAL